MEFLDDLIWQMPTLPSQMGPPANSPEAMP